MEKIAGITSLIRRGESETVEFKESFGKEAIETVCAFANTKGGNLIIGVNDKGALQGAQIGKNILKNWADRIAQETGLQPSIMKNIIQGKNIINIHIQESRIKPVMFHGRAYKRVGGTTRKIAMEELTRMILNSAGATWDELPEQRAGMKDIDPLKIGK